MIPISERGLRPFTFESLKKFGLKIGQQKVKQTNHPEIDIKQSIFSKFSYLVTSKTGHLITESTQSFVRHLGNMVQNQANANCLRTVLTIKKLYHFICSGGLFLKKQIRSLACCQRALHLYQIFCHFYLSEKNRPLSSIDRKFLVNLNLQPIGIEEINFTNSIQIPINFNTEGNCHA